MSQLLQSCSVLKEMFEEGVAVNNQGERVPLNSNIPRKYAEALYAIVRRETPRVVIEIGMAMGTSTLAILAGLRDAGAGGKLISIDPSQSTVWKGCGVTAVRRASHQERHEFIEDYDYVALPRLLSSGLKVDFAYVDGWHTFDYTLLDWWYLDKMLRVSGVLAFNDCGWPAVDKAIGCLLSHRKYDEFDVQLPVTYVGEGHERRLEDRYFRKREAWEPRWDFFTQF